MTKNTYRLFYFSVKILNKSTSCLGVHVVTVKHSSMTDYSKLYRMRIIKPGTSLATTEKIDSQSAVTQSSVHRICPPEKAGLTPK